MSLSIYTYILKFEWNRTFDCQKTRLIKIIWINSINEISCFVDIASWNNFNVIQRTIDIQRKLHIII